MTDADTWPGGRTVLVALGGNAMSAPDGTATEPDQIAALTAAAEHIADLVDAGHRVAVTHGNGPQVGNLLVKNELAAHVVPPVSLDWCVAQTQATIGFVLCDALEAALAARGREPRVAALVTRTLVDADDPAFDAPSKPIGRYRSADEAAAMIAHGQHWADLGERGWRRVVASPEPREILDAATGRDLLDAGVTIVLGGGGGVPVVRAVDGRLTGVEAVIDKDLSAAVLGPYLGCDTLVIATDVPHAVVGFGTPDAEPLRRVSVDRVRHLLDAGEFGAGSMAPKMTSAARFAAAPGRTAIVTTLDGIAAALAAEHVGGVSIGTIVTLTGLTRRSR